MNKSPIGRSFHDIVQARASRDTAFAESLLEEAVQCLLMGDVDVGRSLIRDVIKGSIGYEALSRLTGTPEKSLVRMFGPSGNPTAANLAAVLHELQHHGGFNLQVKSRPLAPAVRARKTGARGSQKRLLVRASKTVGENKRVSATRYASVWDAVAKSSGEAACLRLRSELMDAVCSTIAHKQWTPTQVAARCGLARPRVNELLRGQISRFSLDALVNIVAALGRRVHIELKAA